MQRIRKRAFTLIELLVVIAVIAILAAILFPVFAQAREKSRMSACLSNMKQIGTGLMMYTQDYDETFPYIRFTTDTSWVWRNAIEPYLKNYSVLACPSNPFGRGMIPGHPSTNSPPKPGDNAEGWQSTPTKTMPISYAMNSCAETWYPADSVQGKQSPPLRMSQLDSPARTLCIAENQWPTSDIHGEEWLEDNDCPGVFVHQAGKLANFVFYDGHAKSKKWLATLYPVTENNWEVHDHPDPTNLWITGEVGCNRKLPPAPNQGNFIKPMCLAYQ